MKIKTSLLFAALLLNALRLLADELVPVGCPTITMSGNQVTCYGGSNGMASVLATGGSNSFTYTWSYGPGPTWSNSISGLPVGTYTVNVKDNVTGCTVVGAYVVDQPDPVSILSSYITNVNCYGENTGAIDVTPTGGTPGPTGYTYDWSYDPLTPGFDDGQDANGLVAGSYSLIVRDANGCTNTSYYNITQPGQALNSSGVVTNVSCTGGMNGSIDVSVWGGSPPYVYSWTPSGSTQDLSGLTIGSYTQTITDVKGCTNSGTYVISEPSALIGSISSTDVSCFGTSTGSVSISMSGGTLPYNYSWQNSQTLYAANSATLSNVPADNYTVNVTDGRGCTFSASTTVNQPPLLSATYVVTDVLCYGDFSGSIDVTVSGGTPSYSFLWTNSLGNPIGTGEDLNAVQAGGYGLLITDINGCTYSFSDEISQPDTALYYSYIVTDVLCFGDATGAIDLTVMGGTQPYTYSWNSGQTSEDLSNIPSGNYSFAVLDANNCPIGGSMIVSQPTAPIAVSSVVSNVLCYGESNGSIDLTVTGGTAPYSFMWENSTFELSLTTEDISGMPADDYTYDLVDNNGCTYSETLTITEPPLLESTISGVNILCYGGDNGSIDLTVTGGTLPYSYSWSNGSTSQDLINLIAGTYDVVVTDANNCTITNTITLTQPEAPLSLYFETVDVKCNNGSDGSVVAFVEGGTTPYTYIWSNGGSTDVIEDLTAGVYTLDIVDFNGCTISGSIEVYQPDPLTLNEVITPVSCYGMSDGVIDITPTGGTSPFDFTWFNSTFALSAQTEDLVDWPADIYQVEIIDSNGCFYEMFFEITQPEPLVITFTTTAVSCNGGSDADILVDITGGNPPYTTIWSNGATTEDLIDIPAGTYQLVVTDTKGCTDSIEATIIEPLPITMTFEVTEITCIDQKDGTAYAFPDGGNGGYYYDWTHGPTTAYVDSLDNQYYYLLVTDVLGCTALDSVFIPKSEALCIDPVNAFTPNGDLYNDTWVIDNMYLYPDADLQIFNKWGNLIHHQTGVYEPWDGSINGAQAPSDQYYFILNLNYLDREPVIGNINIVR
ncbi:MAG: T9SS type B sorting domain-containing protein [Bacteroidetes bacterium]|nr:MAG: T9SS type B sorting domain-containing protein [Bacteroidota bacterium]